MIVLMSQVIRFEKVVPEGKAMGRLDDGRAVFAIGPLPGELARVGIRKHRKSYADAVLRDIIEPSPHRIHDIDEHTMSTAPWQGVEYEYQLELKRQMCSDAYRQNHIEVADISITGSDHQTEYRNRLDFSIAKINGVQQLAFHTRGSWDSLIPISGSNLGSDEMNTAADDLLQQLNQLQYDVTPALITVRHARSTGELITILTTESRRDWKKIETSKIGNFAVARPLKGSGAPGPISFQNGSTYITERIHKVKVSYSYNGFFQVNTPTFEKALDKIISAANDHKRIVELYSGVGAIGLPLAANGAQVNGIEISPEAVELALKNAYDNKLPNYEAVAVAAEYMDTSLLEGADCIIVDPPRAGLHKRVINWLLESNPKTIIYLSCNPVTQARDVSMLSDNYDLRSLEAFDFYPGTLHLESLAILQRR